MFKPPAHKSGTAGQIKDPLPSQKVNREPRITVPKYLHEEIARIENAEKSKLSMNEWWYLHGNDFLVKHVDYEAFEIIWKAAQENA